MENKEAKQNVLVATPSFAGGSWVFLNNILEEILSARPDVEIAAVGLGRVFHRSRFKYFTVPYPRYDRWGYITVKSSLLAFLWDLPIYLIGNVLILVKRPRLVIGNGFASVAALIVGKWLGAHIMVTHQVKGSFNNTDGLPGRLFKYLLSKVELVIANSKGCAQDLVGLMPLERIMIVELWADDIFFENPIEKKMSSEELTFLYVGRLDEVKFCFAPMEMAKRYANHEGIRFIFAGIGEYSSELARMAESSRNIEYVGYIGDRKELAYLYRRADIVWSYADETYLGLPALEALACGRPIIMPKFATLTYKDRRDETDATLVPAEIGWMIDPYDSNGIGDLLESLMQKGVDESMPKNCRQHALKKYSSSNVKPLLEKIESLL